MTPAQRVPEPLTRVIAPRDDEPQSRSSVLERLPGWSALSAFSTSWLAGHRMGLPGLRRLCGDAVRGGGHRGVRCPSTTRASPSTSTGRNSGRRHGSNAAGRRGSMGPLERRGPHTLEGQQHFERGPADSSQAIGTTSFPPIGALVVPVDCVRATFGCARGEAIRRGRPGAAPRLRSRLHLPRPVPPGPRRRRWGRPGHVAVRPAPTGPRAGRAEHPGAAPYR